jgi:hypothetical protein
MEGCGGSGQEMAGRRGTGQDDGRPDSTEHSGTVSWGIGTELSTGGGRLDGARFTACHGMLEVFEAREDLHQRVSFFFLTKCFSLML